MRSLLYLVTLTLAASSACSKKSNDQPAQETPPVTQAATDPVATPATPAPAATTPATPATPVKTTTATPIAVPSVPTVAATIPNPDAPSLSSVTVYNPDPNGQFPPVMPTCAVAPCTVRETELIFVVDTSASMWNKADMIRRNLDATIAFFRPFPNVHITLVGDSYNDCGEPSINFPFDPSIRRFPMCVNSYNAMGRLSQALTAMPFSPTARIEAVVISDGDAAGVGNRYLDFNPTFQSQPVIVSSIVGYAAASGFYLCGGVCTFQAPGFQYMEMAQRTGGGVFEICNPNWSPLLISLYNRML